MLDGLKRQIRRARVKLGLDVPTVICESVMGLKLEYAPASAIGRNLYFHRSFELAELRFGQHLLAAVDSPVILDIGANLGIHSIFWARAIPGLTGHLFEPSQATGRLLRRNLERNSVENRLSVHSVALSDAVGKVPFFECQDSAYSSLKNTGREPIRQVSEVDCCTLDDWARQQSVGTVDLVKIDVEGFEQHVIRGGQSTLAALRPHLLVEIYGGENSNLDPAKTVSSIVELGYRAYVLRGDGAGRIVPYVRHDDRFYNYYFQPA